MLIEHVQLKLKLSAKKFVSTKSLEQSHAAPLFLAYIALLDFCCCALRVRVYAAKRSQAKFLIHGKELKHAKPPGDQWLVAGMSGEDRTRKSSRNVF